MGENPSPTQSLPVPNDGDSMHDLVCQDLMRRKEFGLQKYGTILQAFNGRNPLLDAYEEIQDLAVYVRQTLIEFEALIKEIENLPYYSGIPDSSVLIDGDIWKSDSPLIFAIISAKIAQK